MPLKLDAHDEAIVATVQAEMKKAILTAHGPVAVAKRIGALAVRQRNRDRRAAIKKHPFNGICEESGLPLAGELAVLDEMEPELGYAGKLRWVCSRANNSGRNSCGGCPTEGIKSPRRG
jgi:hypothetical protein